jgi:N-acetylmuramoyl-L-alanine amidase
MKNMPSTRRFHRAAHPEQPRLSILPKVFGVAVLLATLFTAWIPGQTLPEDLAESISRWLAPQPEVVLTPAAPTWRIGIVSGHSGYDSGAVCRDAAGRITLTEADVNLNIAFLVQKKLLERGYQVDLLNEFDARLNGYKAVALVSIHNDSCDYINEQATGFKVAPAMTARDAERSTRLTQCMINRYQQVTGLPFHAGSITPDMRDYHAFTEIDPNTVAAIIETGFLNLDRDFLINQADLVAEGIVKGIDCFVRNESIEPAFTPVSP